MSVDVEVEVDVDVEVDVEDDESVITRELRSSGTCTPNVNVSKSFVYMNAEKCR